jgi:hypothetical protein
MHRVTWLALLSLACSNAPAQPPSPAPTSPEQLAAVILAADSAGDWATILRFAHPDALEEFHRTQVTMLEPTTFEGLDSCMIGSLSATFAKQRESHLRFTLDSIFLVPSVDSLKHLPAGTAFTRYGQYWARVPRPPRLPDTPTRKILGGVSGPGNTSYVVVYEHYATRPFPEWPTERTEIMTFRQVAGAWRSMLDGPVQLGSASGFVMFEDGD